MSLWSSKGDESYCVDVDFGESVMRDGDRWRQVPGFCSFVSYSESNTSTQSVPLLLQV